MVVDIEERYNPFTGKRVVPGLDDPVAGGRRIGVGAAALLRTVRASHDRAGQSRRVVGQVLAARGARFHQPGTPLVAATLTAEPGGLRVAVVMREVRAAAVVVAALAAVSALAGVVWAVLA